MLEPPACGKHEEFPEYSADAERNARQRRRTPRYAPARKGELNIFPTPAVPRHANKNAMDSISIHAFNNITDNYLIFTTGN